MDQVFLPSDAELETALAALNAKIAANKETAAAHLSESLLKRTLWAKHNDIKSSESLLKAYAHWHATTLGNPSARLAVNHVHAFLLTNILQVLPTTDKDGLPMVYMKPNKYLPNKIPWQHVVCALVYLLEYLTSTNEKAAKYGFTFMVWKLIKGMMSEDLASKFQFTTSETVDSLVELKNLPTELGGQFVVPADGMATFVKDQYAREGLKYEEIDLNNHDWAKYRPIQL
ncbi:UNVERIFIED_CONTAM: hypothetical protein HDU68_011633 [Siphonaria sp. JEL0065]|nr:hypothetical protein HDU68_011633 [Siphonaria sp. JEL0065]